MKKLFLIVATLFVAVSFSSCDKGDEGGEASTQMRYVKHIVGIETKDKAEFEYDSQNRITKYSCTEYDDQSKTEHLYVWEFTYEGNLVKAKEVHNTTWNDNITFELNSAGYVTHRTATMEGYGPYVTEYTYNNEGGLIKEKYRNGDIGTYRWIDGNCQPDNYLRITYSPHKTPKCNLDFSTNYILDNMIGWTFPEGLFRGNPSANLPTELFYKDGESDQYSFQFDDKGYISEVTLYNKKHYHITYY